MVEGPHLERYSRIVQGKACARYLLARSMPVILEEGLTLPEMWRLHDDAMRTLRKEMEDERRPCAVTPSLLDLKGLIARQLLKACCLCEHACGVDRGHVRGRCGVLDTRISSHFVHMGEEDPLVPSYTIFFSGCNLRCVFCQNYDISTRPDDGGSIPAEEMASLLGVLGRHRDESWETPRRGRRRIRNINWVGGDPTPHLHYILDVLGRSSANIAQVWNSNMYLSERGMSLLDGCIDIYLTDLKFGNDACALRLSGAPDYFQIVTRNHLIAAQQTEVIVRHLMLPGHLECCTLPVVDWLTDHLPTASVNIMAQYHPAHRAWEHPELRGRITDADHERVLRLAKNKGLVLI